MIETNTSTLDRELAHKLLGRNMTTANAAFICFLSKCTSQGHLCVQINETAVFPVPEAEEDLIRQGVKELPNFLVSEVQYSDNVIPLTPICKCEDRYYFQRYWKEEAHIYKELNRILDMTPEYIVETNYAEQLNSEQNAAILKASQRCLTIICGGPGTGKTYTAGQLIKLFWDKNPKCEVALAAPTGKAASNLESSLNKALGFTTLKAKTLHALLGISGAKRVSQFLSADLILIDECSMIDVHLMSELLAAVKPGARLILLGDPHQLPPVDAGSIFSDFVELLKLGDNVIELKTCLRIEMKGILQFAQCTREGNAEEAISSINLGSGIKLLTHEALCQKVLKNHLKFPEKLFYEDHQGLFKQFLKFRILSPIREGPFGVEAINQLIFKQFWNRCLQPIFVAPIMIAQNDYQLDLFNGETGILIMHHTSDDTGSLKKGDFALFPRGNELKKIPAALLPKFEFAYCISVHKSQGSEFDEVLLLMPEASVNFGREAIYTAATRAKKELIIWGNEAVIKSAIMRRSTRYSGLFTLSLVKP